MAERIRWVQPPKSLLCVEIWSRFEVFGFLENITTFREGVNFQKIEILKIEMGSSGWRGSIRLAEAVWSALVQNLLNSGKNKYSKRVQTNLIIHPSLLPADAGNYIFKLPIECPSGPILSGVTLYKVCRAGL